MYVGEDTVPRRLVYIGSVEGNPVYMYSPHEDVRLQNRNKRNWSSRKKKKTARGRYNRSAAVRAKMSAAQTARWAKKRAAKEAATAPTAEL